MTVTSNLSAWHTPLRYVLGSGGKPALATSRDTPVGPLDPLRVRCHGGLATVMWEVGDLEPTVPNTGITLSIRWDGRIVATLLKGSTRGDWNDAPAQMTAVVPCRRGIHHAAVTIDMIHGGWGIPYAYRGDRTLRGFIVRETWNPRRR